MEQPHTTPDETTNATEHEPTSADVICEAENLQRVLKDKTYAYYLPANVLSETRMEQVKLNTSESNKVSITYKIVPTDTEPDSARDYVETTLEIDMDTGNATIEQNTGENAYQELGPKDTMKVIEKLQHQMMHINHVATATEIHRKEQITQDSTMRVDEMLSVFDE